MMPYPLDTLFERNIQESDVILSNAIDCDQALGSRLQNRQHYNYYQRSFDALVLKLKNIICRSYRDASLHIYGSCLSDLALGNSSDVDISLHLPEALQAKQNFAKGTLPAASYDKIMKRHVWKIGRKITDYGGSSGFVDIEIITRARVPVIKGKYLYANNPYTQDGAINFDLCFLNDEATMNLSWLHPSVPTNDVGVLWLRMERPWQHLADFVFLVRSLRAATLSEANARDSHQWLEWGDEAKHVDSHKAGRRYVFQEKPRHDSRHSK